MSKTAPINMRVEPSQRDLLNRAAELSNMDRSTFILNAACREAENVLLDQRLFIVSEETFNAFESALDAPIPNAEKLKALLTNPSRWD